MYLLLKALSISIKGINKLEIYSKILLNALFFSQRKCLSDSQHYIELGDTGLKYFVTNFSRPAYSLQLFNILDWMYGKQPLLLHWLMISFSDGSFFFLFFVFISLYQIINIH